jgi:membrane dipeptidase
VPFFLGAVEHASLTTWLDHVDHVARVVGPEHVALGTDWPMPGPKWTLGPFAAWSMGVGFREEHGMNLLEHNLPGFDDYRDLPNLTRGLVSRGYGDAEIQGMLGGNALRVFEAVVG